jgi:1,2-phenylacetyl-CoA epoxidase PaaB subunit
MIYEVFARKSRGEPLRHIGNVTAPDDELARVYAFQTYDEERWLDMWVTPRDRLIEVFNRREADIITPSPTASAGTTAAVPLAAPATTATSTTSAGA